MAAGRRRCWRGTVLLSAFLAGPAWGEGDPVTFEDRVRSPDLFVLRSFVAYAEIRLFDETNADVQLADVSAYARRRDRHP